MQRSAVQYNAMQCSAVQYSEAQYSATLHCTDPVITVTTKDVHVAEKLLTIRNFASCCSALMSVVRKVPGSNFGRKSGYPMVLYNLSK